MNTFNVFAAVLGALGVRDIINYIAERLEDERRKKNLRLWIEKLEDDEADDDED